MPSVMKQPLVIVFGFAGICFCGAIESAARMVYFHHRRRQIQIEDGTWEAASGDNPAPTAALFAEVPGKTAKADSYMAKATAFSLITSVIATATLLMRTIAGGHWIAALFVLLWSGFAIFRIRHRMRWSHIVSYALFVTPVKVVVYFGVLTLLLFNVACPTRRLLRVGRINGRIRRRSRCNSRISAFECMGRCGELTVLDPFFVIGNANVSAERGGCEAICRR